MEEQGKNDQKTPSLPIAQTEFQRVAEKVQVKKENVAFGLLKLKVIKQGVKTLTEEKKETKFREWEELLDKAEKATLSTKKGKAKKTLSELCEKLEKELEEESPIE